MSSKKSKYPKCGTKAGERKAPPYPTRHGPQILCLVCQEKIPNIRRRAGGHANTSAEQGFVAETEPKFNQNGICAVTQGGQERVPEVFERHSVRFVSREQVLLTALLSSQNGNPAYDAQDAEENFISDVFV